MGLWCGLKRPRFGRRAIKFKVVEEGMSRSTPLPHWGERTYVMGIINVTPDSFSGDGLLTEREVVARALAQAEQFVRGGADILDIGGESTRPGAAPVSAEEEMARVLPVIEALSRQGWDAILSVDTYKAEVAEAALRLGAHWVNDVWGLRADERMAEVVARYGAVVILMHNRSQPQHAELRERLGGRYVGIDYEDLIEDIKRELLASVALAQAAGVPHEHIILDPGIGFGKTVEQNLVLIQRLDAFKALGYPILLGPSRKSFIGYTLNLPPDQRLEGTLAAVVLGVERGADIVRVHDVEAVVRAVRMTEAILRAG
jgi:dihydropteroate synthase